MQGEEDLPEFGIKRENEERRDGGCAVIYYPKTGKYAVGKREDDLFILFGGGVDSKEDIKAGVLREVDEESGLYDFLHIEKVGDVICHYHNSTRNVNRVAKATCFLIILQSDKAKTPKLEEHEKFTLAWARGEEIFQSWESRNQNKDYEHWTYFLEKAMKRIAELGY